MSNEQRLAQYYNKVSKDVMEASKKLRLLIMQGYEMAFAKTMLTSLFTQEIVDSAEGFLMLFITSDKHLQDKFYSIEITPLKEVFSRN